MPFAVCFFSIQLLRSRHVQIWVDADACPVVIKEILYRAAQRTAITTTLVANKPLRTPASPFIRAIQVPMGMDVADNMIAQHVRPGDLVVTADIPLAAIIVGLGAHGLNPRGEFYSAETISERLAVRNLMDELRTSGVDIGGPARLGQADRQEFANQLDRFLAKWRAA